MPFPFVVVVVVFYDDDDDDDRYECFEGTFGDQALCVVVVVVAAVVVSCCWRFCVFVTTNTPLRGSRGLCEE